MYKSTKKKGNKDDIRSLTKNIIVLLNLQEWIFLDLALMQYFSR